MVPLQVPAQGLAGAECPLCATGGPALWPTRPGEDHAGPRHREARGVQRGGDERQVSLASARPQKPLVVVPR